MFVLWFRLLVEDDEEDEDDIEEDVDVFKDVVSLEREFELVCVELLVGVRATPTTPDDEHDDVEIGEADIEPPADGDGGCKVFIVIDVDDVDDKGSVLRRVLSLIFVFLTKKNAHFFC